MEPGRPELGARQAARRALLGASRRLVGASSLTESSVVIPEGLEAALRAKFLGYGSQEDGGFGTWTPVVGKNRRTAIFGNWVWPERGEVEHHGNISLSTGYYARSREQARERRQGLLIAHSHPDGGGWQEPSGIDLTNEQEHLAREVRDVTGLPLVGLVLSGEGRWSARFYEDGEAGSINRVECVSVRTVGQFLRVHFNPRLRPAPKEVPAQRRTRTVWGTGRHADLCRLRVGIVGLGSVGLLVAEQLARVGITELLLVEFDKVEEHNRDRLIHATEADARKRVEKLALAK